MRTDSPIEWTGEAHLVTRSCVECGRSLKISESAASRSVVTCEDCEHDCLDNFGEGRQDPSLPSYIVVYECQRCGETWRFDTETAEHEVDR